MGVQMYVSSLLFIYSDARLLKDDSSIFNYLRNFPAVSYCSCTHFTLLTTMLKGFLFLHILAKLTIFCIFFFFLVFCIFDSGHHNGCEMVSWSWDLHFSDMTPKIQTKLKKNRQIDYIKPKKTSAKQRKQNKKQWKRVEQEMKSFI